MLYMIKMGHNTMETTKNLCCEKGNGEVDKMVLEILLGL